MISSTPQSCKYLAEVQMFGVYCQDYKACSELVEFFAGSVIEFKDILQADFKARKLQLKSISSRAIRNVADVYVRKISQALATICKIAEKFNWVLADLRQKRSTMLEIREANQLKVQQWKQKLEQLSSSLNKKENQFQQVVEKIKKVKENTLTSEIIKMSYGDRSKSISLERQQLEWKTHKISLQIQWIKSQLNSQRQLFQDQSQEEVTRLKNISRKLFDLSYRLPGEHILLKQQEYLAQDRQNPQKNRLPFGPDQQNHINFVPSQVQWSQYENSFSSLKKLQKAEFLSEENLLVNNQHEDNGY